MSRGQNGRGIHSDTISFLVIIYIIYILYFYDLVPEKLSFYASCYNKVSTTTQPTLQGTRNDFKLETDVDLAVSSTANLNTVARKK